MQYTLMLRGKLQMSKYIILYMFGLVQFSLDFFFLFLTNKYNWKLLSSR